MFGRKRTESGGLVELRTYFERFESQPPPEAELSRREWSAFHKVAHALVETAKAEDRGNAGRRIYSGCSCSRCRNVAKVVALPTRQELRRAA